LSHLLIFLFFQKIETEEKKNLIGNQLKKLPQTLRLARPRSSGELQASTKAWAANLGAHLGLMMSKMTMAVHLRSTVKREFRLNKNQAWPLPPKP
jgi:hypothetical protein